QMILARAFMAGAAAEHGIQLEGDHPGKQPEDYDIEKFGTHLRPSPVPFLRPRSKDGLGPAHTPKQEPNPCAPPGPARRRIFPRRSEFLVPKPFSSLPPQPATCHASAIRGSGASFKTVSRHLPKKRSEKPCLRKTRIPTVGDRGPRHRARAC